MAKYKVGDKVLVRTDIEDDIKYYMDDKSDYWYFIEDMYEYRGKVVTITRAEKYFYKVDEDDGDNEWTDEMFVGLVEETPKALKKFKVGDRVRSLEAPWGTLKVGDLGTVIHIGEFHYGVEWDNKCGGHTCDGKGKVGHCFWTKEQQIELIEESKSIPEEAPTLNDIVDPYENACWYCRKGGIVDLYLTGVMGICPSCGRVCNNTRPKGFTLTNSRTVVFDATKAPKAPKAPKKENTPLTKEELEALPNGTKVYIVWRWNMDSDSKENPKWNESGWGTKDGKSCKWSYEGCEETHQSIESYDRTYDAYLEEPERK